ncbi:hypothetical protein J4464_02260 [Candidatus Woesearchaeota archaeon]|nr:hypothetical protein [Candidatus Woesearchaeota archaeon]
MTTGGWSRATYWNGSTGSAKWVVLRLLMTLKRAQNSVSDANANTNSA